MYKLTVTKYNNENFTGIYFSNNKFEALKLKKKLKTLNFVTNVSIQKIK